MYTNTKQEPNPYENDTLIEQAIVEALPKKSIGETEWMDINGYTVKYKAVPPMVYNKARQSLRRKLKSNKPLPPKVEKGGRSYINQQDPYYLEQLELWNEELTSLEDESMVNTAILAGIIIKGDIPNDNEWLPSVIDTLVSLGMDTDNIFKSFMYNANKMKELYFKQYIILSTTTLLEQFMNYQTKGILPGESANTNVPQETNEVEDSINLFQSS